ncbi:hypothetical protein [Methylomagnum sp.]
MTKKNLTKGLCVALLLASPMVGADPQYPAADFQPVIISQDADLIAKHSQAASARASESPKSTQAATSVVSANQSNPSAAETKPEQPINNKEEASMENYPIALVILALAGFIFWSTKRSGSASQSVKEEASALLSGTVGGETGVAKYLRSVSESAIKVTGVSKYLTILEAEAKEKAVVAKEASKTGVEKYLDSVGH